MEKSQLAEMLRSLSRSEFKEFGKFTASPFFNSRNEVVRFYGVLKKFYPGFKGKNFTNEKLFYSVYPGKKYSDVLMRKLVSLMLNLLLRFFTEIKFRDNKLAFDFELIEALHKRKLFSTHKKRFSAFIEYINSSKETMEIYEYRYKAANELRNIEGPSGEKARLAKSYDPLNSIYNYFFSVVLNEYLQFFALIKNDKKTPDLKLYNDIIKYIKKIGYFDHPLIHSYYLMLMLLTSPEEKYFYELNEFGKENSVKLEKVHNYNIAVILIDYCMGRIAEGNAEFRRIMFELSQRLDDENLMETDFTEPLTFINVIRNSSVLKEFEWSNMFINKYKNGLSPVFRDSLISFAAGCMEFEKGNFAASLKYLSSVSPKWNYMRYDIKKIIMKNYYELGYREELISQLDALRHILKNDNNTLHRHKALHMPFIRFITKLVNMHLKGDFKPAHIIKKDIQNSGFFLHKDWLLEKTVELIKTT